MLRFIARLSVPLSAFAPLLASAALAASPLPVPLATYRAEAPGFKGDSATVRVRVVIPKGWHLQSNAPLDDFLIPTELKTSGEGLAFGTPVFPKAKMKDLEALGGKVALFEDTLNIRVPARLGRGVRGGDAEKALAGAVVSLRYQACNDSQCLPPKVIAAKYAPSEK
jgi:hypothetical protein